MGEAAFRDGVFGTIVGEQLREANRSVAAGLLRATCATTGLAHALAGAAKATRALADVMPRRKSGGRLR